MKNIKRKIKFNSFQKFLLAAVFAGTVSFSFSQDSSSVDSLLWKYKFINPDASVIHNDVGALDSFFDKLHNLQKEKKGKVSVVHIGDSHIQADYFSGRLRKDFQRDFGNAGRGLIFPYQVAKTNGPPDYRSTSKADWQAKRNVFPDQPLPIGISGITIQTNDSTADISIRLKDKEGIDYSSNKMTLFHYKSAESYDFCILDSLGKEIGSISSENKTGTDFTSNVRFANPVSYLTLKCCAKNSTQNCARVFGVELENDSAGIIYHMIGVNGAMYEHYLKSEYFSRQLPELKPDLVILSLGTNESQHRNLDSLHLWNKMDSLIQSIRTGNPKAKILVTLPGDSFIKMRKNKKRYYTKNPELLEVKKIIMDYCKQNNIAYWDLMEVMGGFGSMGFWYKAGMADRYRMHFTAKGYGIQAELLYRALMKSYDTYLAKKQK